MPFAEEFNATAPGQDIWSPAEGNLDDPDTRQAVFDILLRHTSGGGEALATAFHWGFDPNPADSEILRGPLSAWPDLFNSEHSYSPQNIWPDTHEWVLNTDPDAWATTVSGTPDLIDDLLHSPHLEAVRPHSDT